MITPIPFYYVRHGQTDWNLNKKLQGATDVPLNQTGMEQAYQARQALRGVEIATIVSSPKIRARQTAEIINEILNKPIVEIDDLREASFGHHEGSTHMPWLYDWLNGDPSSAPQGVEPLDQFIARAKAAINTALTHPGPVLIVAHGGTFMPIRESLHPDFRKPLKNARPALLSPPSDNAGFWQVNELVAS